MTVSLCKHSFPLQPPHGSLGNPGDCTGCGITYNAWEDELAAQEQRVRVGTAARGTCQGCWLPDRMLFTFKATERPWHGFDTDDVPQPSRLCTPCWSTATQADERGDFLTFTDAFDHGTDEQLLDFLGLGVDA